MDKERHRGLSRIRKNDIKGFTLIEVIIFTVLGTLMIVNILSLTYFSQKKLLLNGQYLQASMIVQKAEEGILSMKKSSEIDNVVDATGWTGLISSTNSNTYNTFQNICVIYDTVGRKWKWVTTCTAAEKTYDLGGMKFNLTVQVNRMRPDNPSAPDAKYRQFYFKVDWESYSMETYRSFVSK